MGIPAGAKFRLFLAVSENPGRYWAELLDLALCNPDCTFLVFTGELPRAATGVGRSRSLLVHPVTPRFRSLTLIESMEAVLCAPAQDTAARGCPLALDGGNTRGSLQALLST